MSIAVQERRHTSFRLPTYLLDGLKKEAKRQKKSMNNMVETMLLGSLECIPNKATCQAMKETMSGKYAGVVNTADYNTFVDSILGENERGQV